MLMNSSYRLPESILIVRDNILKKMHPLGLSVSECGSWCIDDPKDTVLYGGCLYSTMEIVYSREALLHLVTSSPDKKLTPKLARMFMGLGPLYKIVVSKKGGKIFDIPRKALEVLKRMGMDVGCLKEEPYVGVLLYELGFHDEFKEYVNRVYQLFKKYGVKRIITLDPHTYELLKYVYPKYITGYDLEILNILDIVLQGLRDGRLTIGGVSKDLKYVFHDPCHYSKSRYRKIIEEPRKVMESLGLRTVESRKSGETSMCCGGPIETYFSMLARKVAEARYKDLVSTGANKIVVSCPICLSSFLTVSKDESKIVDLIELIYEGLER